MFTLVSKPSSSSSAFVSTFLQDGSAMESLQTVPS